MYGQKRRSKDDSMRREGVLGIGSRLSRNRARARDVSGEWRMVGSGQLMYGIEKVHWKVDRENLVEVKA